MSTGPDTRDLHTVRSQLGRAPRGIRAVGHRCPCGNPDVVVTEPRLADGSPFPTTYYLTCPRAASRIGTLEADGVMREMEQRLADDEGLAAAYAGAHQRYLAARAELGEVPEIAGISAGGMPNRVKCLHVLAAQALAQGPGVNPLGDEVLARLGDWWALVPAWSPRVVEVGAQRASRPVAAIDCGTNTIKLLIGTLPEIAVRETRTVRLGEDVDRTGRLGDGALARTYAAIDEYAVLVRDHGVPVERVRFCATSATRDADNAAEFADGVQQRLGVRPDVLSGTEEAALSFDGAVRNLRDEPALPVLVLDIGGGSTELIRGARLDAPPTAAHSMDIGSVRLFERHLRSDPPTREQVAACVRDIDAHLDACPVAVDRAATVVGVSGTSLTVAAGALGVAYAPETLDQAVVPVADVREVVDRLVSMTVAERLALPYVSAGRADVIAAGALILTSVLRRTPVDSLVVSVADILDGIAWSIQG